jgi:hypothetical protein
MGRVQPVEAGTGGPVQAYLSKRSFVGAHTRNILMQYCVPILRIEFLQTLLWSLVLQ